MVEGIDCGECSGPTEVCREVTGECEDVCLWRECGETEGIDCGICPDDEICIAGQCFEPVCQDGMCDVPAGTFWMGCNEEVDHLCEDDEYPYHEVYLDAFEIDQYEVTQAQYYICVLDGICEIPNDFDPEMHGDNPVVCNSWGRAITYCEWAGKRLCTEAEWEKAARGTDGRRYPWGNEPATCEHAVIRGCSIEDFMPVGSKPAGASPYGAMDMAGNIREWIFDSYSSTYYSQCAQNCVNPQGPTGSNHVLRGGGSMSWANDIRVSNRISTGSYEGFRCCR
ncbi:formylglycine-generating enzyme family protein [Myxococcota bacterium]